MEKYSYSKLECYKGCAFKYKLKYVDKLNFFAQNIATELGTCVHSIEEDIANAIKAGETINYITLKNRLILKSVLEKHFNFYYIFYLPNFLYGIIFSISKVPLLHKRLFYISFLEILLNES